MDVISHLAVSQIVWTGFEGAEETWSGRYQQKLEPQM